MSEIVTEKSEVDEFASIEFSLTWHPQIGAIRNDRLSSIAEARSENFNNPEHSAECRVWAVDLAWDLYSDLASWAEYSRSVILPSPMVSPSRDDISISWRNDFGILRILLEVEHQEGEAKIELSVHLFPKLNKETGEELLGSDTNPQELLRCSRDDLSSETYDLVLDSFPSKLESEDA